MSATSDNSRPSKLEDARARALIERYQAPLRAYFRKRIGDAGDVDDLVQDLFIRLINRGSGDALENPDAYIFQAASNLLRDRYRRDTTRSRFERDLPFLSEQIEEIGPERVLQGREDVKLLAEALAGLPARTRNIFLLHRFERLKYREIADRLDISVSSVEKHIATAIKQVMVRLDKKQ